MEIEELRMLLDLNVGNEKAILEKHTQGKQNGSFIFVDDQGKCWLFDENGKLGDGKIKSIGVSAFWNCTSLASIEIPNSVKSIERWAFENCTSLKSIEIPDSIERIKDEAFENCTSLTSIEIPNSVKNIGDWAFYACKSLKSIIFKGKTLEQVKAMDWYPWGIEDESIIEVA